MNAVTGTKQQVDAQTQRMEDGTVAALHDEYRLLDEANSQLWDRLEAEGVFTPTPESDASAAARDEAALRVAQCPARNAHDLELKLSLMGEFSGWFESPEDEGRIAVQTYRGVLSDLQGMETVALAAS